MVMEMFVIPKMDYSKKIKSDRTTAVSRNGEARDLSEIGKVIN